MKHIVLVLAIISFIVHTCFMIYKPEFTAYGFVNICIMAVPALLYVYLIFLRMKLIEKEKKSTSAEIQGK